MKIKNFVHMIKHIYIKIYGFVQGVSFRYSTKVQAEKLGINGWIENLPNGSVYIEVEGEEEKLKKFLGWCRRGPVLARVEKIDFDFDSDLRHFQKFIIKK